MSNNGIWASDTLEQLHAGAAQLASVTLEIDDSTLDLPLTGGTISWDERRAPQVEATLTVQLPDLEGTIASIDPRRDVRARVYAGYKRIDGTTDVQLLANLVLRAAEADIGAQTMTLTCASDECRVIDASYMANVTASGTLLALVKLWITQANGATTFVDETLSAGATLAAEPIAHGADRWTVLQEYAQREGWRVFCPGDKRFWITPNTTLEHGHDEWDLKLSPGPDGILLDRKVTTQRDDWCNRVYLVYAFRAAGGVETVVRGSAVLVGGPYAVPQAPPRDYTEVRSVPATLAAANAAAAAALYNLSRRGQVIDVSAVSTYWLRPGDTFRIATSDAPEEPGTEYVATRVSFDLAAGRMSVQTRTTNV